MKKEELKERLISAYKDVCAMSASKLYPITEKVDLERKIEHPLLNAICNLQIVLEEYCGMDENSICSILQRAKEYSLKKAALEVLKKLGAEEGNYSEKTGFPEVFEGNSDWYIVSGRLAKESEEKDGPFYVHDWVKDDDIFVGNLNDNKVYKIRSIKDLMKILDGYSCFMKECESPFYC